jgi:Holliday junction resolvasome RuvABC endonuclease subunit
MVELTDGEMTDFRYFTDKAGTANKSKKRGSRINIDAMKKAVGKDRHRWMMLRLDEASSHVLDWASRNPDYVGLEDYAIRAEQGAHYLGEIGGLARMTAWRNNIPLRLHDPTSVKMFVCHDGTAPKDEMEQHVASRWGVDFSVVNSGKDRTSSEDLADAYSMARLTWVEVQLRRGIIALRSLHEKEIRVFHRVTKTNPVCLLEREWIERIPKDGKSS